MIAMAQANGGKVFISNHVTQQQIKKGAKPGKQKRIVKGYFVFEMLFPNH